MFINVGPRFSIDMWVVTEIVIILKVQIEIQNSNREGWEISLEGKNMT